ncbi:MAG: T9SS type A sorting domain-containing protein [Paludibacter sp.]
MYSNTAKDYVMFEFNNNSSNIVFCKVTDLTGKVLVDQSFQSVEGENVERIKILNWAKETYLASLKIDDKLIVLKITVD